MKPTLTACLAIIATLSTVAACQDTTDEPRPPQIEAGGGGSPVGVGDGDGDGQGGEGPTDEDPVSGTLSRYNDDAFSASTVYEGSGDVYIISEDGLDFEQRSFEGGQVTLPTLEDPTSRWVSFNPQGDFETMPTIERFNLAEGEVVTPRLVARTAVEVILTTLNSAPSLNENAAQILVKVVDSAGEPIPGAVVSFATGGGIVTYRVGTTWNEDEGATGESGLIFIANVIGASLPGTSVELILTGSIDAEASIVGVNGSVTVATVVVP